MEKNMIQHTSELHREINELLNAFKKIYRSNKPLFIQSGLNLEDLGITRKKFQSYSDKQLYNIVKKLIIKISKITSNTKLKTFNHTGLLRFNKTLQNILDSYIIHHNEGVHLGRMAARVNLHLVQQAHSKQTSVEPTILKEVKILSSYNNKETNDILLSCFKTIEKENRPLFKHIQANIN